jgi:hypothetical protein
MRRYSSMLFLVVMLVGCGLRDAVPQAASPSSTRSLSARDMAGKKPAPQADLGTLFVSVPRLNEVLSYRWPYDGAPGKITRGVSAPGALAVSSSGELFVANAATVSGYATSRYSGKKSGSLLDVIQGLHTYALSADGSNHLFAVGGNGYLKYGPPYRQAQAITLGDCVEWEGVDKAGNVFFDGYCPPLSSDGQLTELFAPSYTRSRTIGSVSAFPEAFTFDRSGHLWVYNANAEPGQPSSATIAEYSSSDLGGNPMRAVGVSYSGAAQLLVGNGERTLFVSGVCCDILDSYLLPSGAIGGVTNGIHNHGAMTVDSNGDLLVLNAGPPGTITEYRRPYVTGKNGGNLYRTIALPSGAVPWDLVYVPQTGTP